MGRSFRAVLDGNPHLDRVLDFDDSILFTAKPGGLPDILRLLRGDDLIFVLDKHWGFTWMAWLARVPRRIGFRLRAFEGWPHTASVAYGPVRHEVLYYLDLLEAAEMPVDREDTRLELPPAVPYDVRGPYVVAVNAGGSSPNEGSAVRQMPPSLVRSARGTPVPHAADGLPRLAGGACVLRAARDGPSGDQLVRRNQLAAVVVRSEKG